MKRYLYIFLLSGLGILWIFGAGDAYAQSLAVKAADESVTSAEQYAFDIARRAIAFFEAPSQAGLPASARVQASLRTVPVPYVPSWPEMAANDCRKSPVTPGRPTATLLKSSRSADHYVYGLRKIIV